LAATIDRYVEAASWAPHLSAVVVSQRVGTIKPHPAMFPRCEAKLVVSRTIRRRDDWVGDGSKAAGWNAAIFTDDSTGRHCLWQRDDEVH
jgi:FMN phosphatase YigB (HAD superfamily)